MYAVGSLTLYMMLIAMLTMKKAWKANEVGAISSFITFYQVGFAFYGCYACWWENDTIMDEVDPPGDYTDYVCDTPLNFPNCYYVR